MVQPWNKTTAQSPTRTAGGVRSRCMGHLLAVIGGRWAEDVRAQVVDGTASRISD